MKSKIKLERMKGTDKARTERTYNNYKARDRETF